MYRNTSVVTTTQRITISFSAKFPSVDMSVSATRWGIASAGLISHDFTNAIIGALPSEDHKVTLS